MKEKDDRVEYTVYGPRSILGLAKLDLETRRQTVAVLGTCYFCPTSFTLPKWKPFFVMDFLQE